MTSFALIFLGFVAGFGGAELVKRVNDWRIEKKSQEYSNLVALINLQIEAYNNKVRVRRFIK